MIGERIMLTIALISDSHGPIDTRIAALAGTCDVIVHAGDICDADVLAWLKRSGTAYAVRGNNDILSKWPHGSARLLNELADCVELSLPGGRLAVIHGHQFPRLASRHRRLRERFADARGIVYGHSHKLLCATESLPWLINPGGCGLHRTFGGPSCVILYAGVRRWSLKPVRYPD